MASILSTQQAQSLRVGIDVVMGSQYAKKAIEWSRIYETRNSTKAFEELLMKSGMGVAQQVSEGAATPLDGGKDEWVKRAAHMEVVLGFDLSRILIEDGQYEDAGQDAGRELSDAFVNRKELEGADLFNNLLSTNTKHLGGDGVPLLSAVHPLGGGSTMSNFLAGMQLSETALDTARIMIARAPDERGNLIGLNAKNLIIPPDLATVAHRLTESTLRPGTNDNDTNWVKDMGFMGKPAVILSRIVSPTTWGIQTDVAKGFIHYKRRAFSFRTEVDNNTRSFKGYADERYSFIHFNPRCFYGYSAV